MQTLALLLAIPAAVALAQAPAPEKPAETLASPEFLTALVAEVPSLTPVQAQGAAGTLFGQAKSKLSAEDFAKIAGVVPNMDGLLKAAPGGEAKGGAKGGGLGTTLAVAGALSKLGLKPDQILKITPALVKVVQSKGGAEVASLLAGALK